MSVPEDEVPPPPEEFFEPSPVSPPAKTDEDRWAQRIYFWAIRAPALGLIGVAAVAVLVVGAVAIIVGALVLIRILWRC